MKILLYNIWDLHEYESIRKSAYFIVWYHYIGEGQKLYPMIYIQHEHSSSVILDIMNFYTAKLKPKYCT